MNGVSGEPATLFNFPGTLHESKCVCATNEEIICQSSYDVCTTFNIGTLTVRSGPDKVPLSSFHLLSNPALLYQSSVCHIH
jgi:hypothetical protein